MILKPTQRIFALALLASTLFGCGADPSRVLARVGKRTITVDEFVEVARDKEGQYPGHPDSAKGLLLDDLVRAALVLSDAERLGLYREPGVAGARELIESEELRQAIYRRLVPTDIPVSEAEIEQLYAWRDSAAHVRAILCPTRGSANAAAAEIAGGARFADIADRFGGPWGAPPGGDLGYLLPGALVPPMDRYLREGPLRTVIGPLESPGEGWFLIEVLERRKRAQPPLDEVRPVLHEMLRQRKVRALRLRAQQALRESYDLRIEPGGAQAMFAYFNQAVGESSGRDPSPAERAVVLARYDSGGVARTYTFADAVTDLSDYEREKPNPALLPSIERWIDAQLVRRLAAIEARRRRLIEEPETVRRIDRRLDGRALDLYYDVEVAHDVEATPEDLREAYERSRESFQRLDAVELLVVTLADSAVAAQVAAHAAHAPSLREAVAMASPGARVAEETVRYPGAPERWKPYQAAFMELSPHGCLGPIAARGGWLVAQLVSKQQGPQAFELLPAEVVQSLRNQAGEIARDRVFNRKVESLRGQLKPEVYRERLRDIPWPVAGPAVSPRS